MIQPSDEEVEAEAKRLWDYHEHNSQRMPPIEWKDVSFWTKASVRHLAQVYLQEKQVA